MDIRELKQLLKHSSSVVVLDGGEPAYVILDYGVYRALSDHDHEHDSSGHSAVPTASKPEPEIPLPVRRPQHIAEVLESRAQPEMSPEDVEAVERLNKEIMALKAQIEAEEQRLASDESVDPVA